MTRYNESYYSYIYAGATRSAGVVLPLVLETFPIGSVADFGCGQGAWLAVWRQLGVLDVVGVDGDYVDSRSLLIPPSCFRPADLQRPVALGRTFDLVQSLEVAQRAYVLDNGLFVLQGSAAEIRNDPDLKRAYLGL